MSAVPATQATGRAPWEEEIPNALAGLLPSLDDATAALDKAVRKYADGLLLVLREPTLEEAAARRAVVVSEYREAVRAFANAIARALRRSE